MALSQSRIINAPSLKLTPSNSPRTPSNKPQPRAQRDDHNLALKQVIGSTTCDSNGLDCLDSARCFAFTAGSAAVIAAVDEDLKITKRFFRAKPTSYPSCPSNSIYDSPSFGMSQVRSRGPRESGFGALSPLSDSTDSPSSRLAASRERMKAATCVALSRDGQLLAVGETGYRPRVLVFSTAKNASTDAPLTILSEHTFGVRCLAFSPDSQYLATLGDMNDGFLYIWSINRNGAATCILINKCTSNIKHIAWLGSSLVTCGTRHVKLWRIENPKKPCPSKRLSDANLALASPSSKALAGRNLLLGPLLDKTFTAITQLSNTKAVVCSDQGDVCVLDDSESSRFYKVADAGFGINAVTLFKSDVVVSGDRGRLMTFDFEHTSSTIAADTRQGQTIPTGITAGIIAIASLGDHVVASTSDRNIQLLGLTTGAEAAPASNIAHQSPAHGGAVQGVHSLVIPNKLNACFYTWSSDGTILFWSSAGSLKCSIKVELDQIDAGDGFFNELKIVQSHPSLDFVVTGDKFGVLRLIDTLTKETMFDVKAHSSEITDIAIHSQEGRTVVASCGRDRMVQLFQKETHGLQLLQTLDEHVGAVAGVLFAKEGQKLISCSSDRSLVVRDLITGSVRGEPSTAYLATRTITLKATPLSMDLHHNNLNIFVSTVDRNVHTLELQSGALLSSFKTGDQEGGDAVIMSSIAHSLRGRNSILIAGVSSTDKSIRVYDESGRLVSRDYGHTEGMTGISAIEDEDASAKSLVTVATDGTIFIWSLVSDADQMQTMLESLDLKPANARTSQMLTRPPLRRVLSSSELSQLQESREEDSISPLPSPTSNRHGLRRKTSRLSMAPTPKLEPIMQASRRETSPQGSTPEPLPLRRRASNIRATSPSSPKRGPNAVQKNGRYSLNPSARRVSSTNDLATAYKDQSHEASFDLATATEQTCRVLHSYRKKIASATFKSDEIPLETVRKLERELSVTARALADRTSTGDFGGDCAMTKLLDQYSERLVGLLDERIENCVVRQKVGTEQENQEQTADIETHD